MDFDQMVEVIDSWTEEHTLHSFARAIKEVLSEEQVALLIENLYVD